MEVQQVPSPGDARSLPVDALEQLRRQAVAAVESGLTQTRVATLFGVSRKAVGNWVRAYQAGGESTLRPRPRGRRTGERLALPPSAQGDVLAALSAGPPDDFGLPWLLWTRRAVAELIARRHGVVLAATTVDKYLLRWELTGPDGTGPRWDQCPPGAVLVAATRPQPPSGPDGLHALVAVSHRGALHFLAGTRPFTGAGFTDFRDRLRMHLGRDVRMIARDRAA